MKLTLGAVQIMRDTLVWDRLTDRTFLLTLILEVKCPSRGQNYAIKCLTLSPLLYDLTKNVTM